LWTLVSLSTDGGEVMQTVTSSHIWLDDRGVAWIDDTNTKVIEVVLDRVAYGLDADAIHREHPHLSLGQIYAALSYYYDHQAEIDAEIERQVREVDALAAQAGESPFVRRMRALGKLP
jgi:uncharacterized protein (DUF433 family)